CESFIIQQWGSRHDSYSIIGWVAVGICNIQSGVAPQGSVQNFSVLLIVEYQQHAEQSLKVVMISFVLRGALSRALVLRRRPVSVGSILRLLLDVPVLIQRCYPSSCDAGCSLKHQRDLKHPFADV